MGSAGLFQLVRLYSFSFFVPGKKIVNLFFDNYHKKVITIEKSGTTANAVIHGYDPSDTLAFPLVCEPDAVVTVKLSYDCKLVAVQKSQFAADFFNVIAKNIDSVSYAQTCKGRNTKLVGIEWVGANEILYITSHGLELYQVSAEKRSVRLLKTHNVNLNWFVYSHLTQVLIVSCGTLGNILHPFALKSGTIVRLPKFEVDLAANPHPPKLVLLDRDLTIASVYDKVYILVLRHNPRPTNAGAEVLAYLLNKESQNRPAHKTHLLKLGGRDRFAVQVIDSLVIVHQQAAKATLVFDLGCAAQRETDHIGNHYPIFEPMALTFGDSGSCSVNEAHLEMYCPSWVLFQPDVVIDAPSGLIWTVSLNLKATTSLISSKVDLMEFLLRRSSAKCFVLDVCRDMISDTTASLTEIGKIFDMFNRIVRAKEHAYNSESSPHASVGVDNTVCQVLIEQAEMYRQVFFPLQDGDALKLRHIANVVIELLLSLQTHDIPIQAYFHELLVHCLIRSNQFHRLHQLVQYHVVDDSKPLAFLILSMEGQYPPALQMAVDMLSRLQTANEEIMEVLLSKQKVLQALRFVQTTGLVGSAGFNPMKFLESAWTLNDKFVFFTVFKYFEQRHLKLKGSGSFARGDAFDLYLEAYKKLSSTSTSPDDQQMIVSEISNLNCS